MSEQHAFCSPSDWEGWSNCPGKPALEEGEPDNDNEYSREGTYAHELAADLLRGGKVDLPPDLAEGIRCYVTAVSARCTMYVNAGAKVTLLVEQKLDISVITGEKGAKGTGDVVIIAEFEDHSVLDSWDLKFGMGVKVYAKDNGQLQIYALAAYVQHSLLHNFTEINIVVHQPRVSEKPDEWQVSVEDLHVFGARVTEAAALALSLRGEAAAVSNLKAGEKQCRFCKVKHRCPELRRSVNESVFGDFQSLEDPEPIVLEPDDVIASPEDFAEVLGRMMGRVPLIESWCLAIRARVESELVGGKPVPGFKLVLGRQGARQWSDRAAVESLLLGDNQSPSVIYEPQSLKSPTQLEKILKHAPIWGPCQELTKRAEGKPSVAPADDVREPYSPPTLGDFDSLDTQDLV